jgi:arylsulfatase A-like enzyme
LTSTPPADVPTAAYAGFGGTVGRTFARSESWWPPRPAPPANAPNVLVVLVDDLGFSDLGCFGSEIATPHLDRLAAGGVRYANFHSTPMCSPTRAALLTGCNPHAAGVGHVAHSDSGFPGYAMELAPNVATIAEILRDNGYATLMIGKWHLAKDSDISDAGPRHAWPCQRGFDRFYGFLDGFTNLHHPHRLVEDNHAVPVDRYPEGYYLTDDLTDRAISMVQSVKASDPAKPFFLYFAHAAVHAPLQAPAVVIERQRGRYREGWDRVREERFRRQLALGVIRESTRLPRRNTEPDHDVPAWADLSPEEQELFARHMEVYAAMVECVDASFGRLRASLEELGEWDNTLVLFTSDNGASREGEATGTTAYYVHLTSHSDVEADHARLDDIGGPRTTPHYPRGWAMASNTPFRLYKINTHAGGHQVATIVRAPARLESGADGAGSVRHQYVHVTDVLPTVLELVGIDAATERAGVPLLPMAGCSFAATLADADAPSTHVAQHYEMQGHRGYYRDGWEAVTLHRPMTSFAEDRWELYDLRADPTEVVDRSHEHPELVAELAEAWEEAAWANQVFPLDEGTFIKHLVRPPGTERFTRPVTLRPGTPTLERWRSQQLVAVRSFRIVVHTEHGAGDAGVLVAHGDQGGGYAMYVEDGALRWVLNDGRGSTRTLDGGPMPEGPATVVADVHAPGGGMWDVTVDVGGEERARGDGFALLFPMAPFEGIDVGIDRRSPVSWDLFERHGPFPYSGALEAVTYEPGDPAPDSPYVLIDTLRAMGARFE